MYLALLAVGLIIVIAIALLVFKSGRRGSAVVALAPYREARHRYSAGEITREELEMVKSNLGNRG